MTFCTITILLQHLVSIELSIPKIILMDITELYIHIYIYIIFRDTTGDFCILSSRNALLNQIFRLTTEDRHPGILKKHLKQQTFGNKLVKV